MRPSFRPQALALVSALLLFSIACQALTGIFSKPTAEQQIIQETVIVAPATEEPVVEPSATRETPEAEGTITPEQTQPPLAGKDVYPPAFADYPAVAVRIPEQAFGGYSLPLNLDEVQGLDDLELSAAQLALIEQNGFVVEAPEPGQYREFYQVYESLRYSTTRPLFVTTDTVFHIYHLIFDKMLRDLERDSFIPILEELTRSLLLASISQMEGLDGTDLEEQTRRNVAFFGVAARLLGLPDDIPADVTDMVNTELALIKTHQRAEISPI